MIKLDVSEVDMKGQLLKQSNDALISLIKSAITARKKASVKIMNINFHERYFKEAQKHIL